MPKGAANFLSHFYEMYYRKVLQVVALCNFALGDGTASNFVSLSSTSEYIVEH